MANFTSPPDLSPGLATPRTPPTLLTLPLEIRIRIYEYVFGEAELRVIGLSGVLADGTRAGVSYHNANRSALRVSKQIRIEARPGILTRTVIVIQDGRNSRLKHGWPARTAGQSASASAALMGWMPPSQVEACTKPTIVRLRISKTGISRYDWQWFTLNHFSSLQVLEIKRDGGSHSRKFHPDEGGLDDPPALEKAAACKDKNVFQWAEERVYGSIGGRENLGATLKIPPSVDLIRTSTMVHTMSGKPDSESNFVGVGLKNNSVSFDTPMAYSVGSLSSRSRYSTNLSTRSRPLEESEMMWIGRTGSMPCWRTNSINSSGREQRSRGKHLDPI